MKKVLSLVLALFVSSFVFASQPQNDKPDIPPGHMMQYQKGPDFEKIAKDLGITDEQKEKLNEMMKEDMSRKKELRGQIKEKMDAVTDELMKENIDMNAINALAAEIQQLSADISRINVESKLKVRSVLSFEQYTKMEQSRRENMEKFKKEFKGDIEKAFKDKADKKEIKKAEKKAEKKAKK